MSPEPLKITATSTASRCAKQWRAAYGCPRVITTASQSHEYGFENFPTGRTHLAVTRARAAAGDAGASDDDNGECGSDASTAAGAATGGDAAGDRDDEDGRGGRPAAAVLTRDFVYIRADSLWYLGDDDADAGAVAAADASSADRAPARPYAAAARPLRGAFVTLLGSADYADEVHAGAPHRARRRVG